MQWIKQGKVNWHHRFLLVVVGILTATVALASDPVVNNDDLNKLRLQIQALQQAILIEKNTQNLLDQQLQVSTVAVGEAKQRVNLINLQIKQNNNKLLNLENVLVQQQQNFAKQQALLLQQIRVAYALSRNTPFKFLLTQQDPNEVSRNLIYFGYLNKTRLRFAQQLQQKINESLQIQQQIVNQAQILQKLRDQQLGQQNKLQMRQYVQSRSLQLVSNTLLTKAQKLSQLRANQHALEEVLRKLPQMTKKSFSSNTSFAKLYGHLPWPIAGNINKHFGSSIAQSEMKYSGVLLAAPAGESVRAIYPGTVVFANKLKGFGLLIIIDHGDGYMTLYGQNQNLIQRVGATVKGGDLIAKVGAASELQQSGLYFEIRCNGKPLNPEMWCSNSITTQNVVLAKDGYYENTYFSGGNGRFLFTTLVECSHCSSSRYNTSSSTKRATFA